MRQTTLGKWLRVQRSPRTDDSIASLIGILKNEDNLAFYAVLPQGNVLKSASELLMRCAPHVPVTADANGIGFVACYEGFARCGHAPRRDPPSGRLIHILFAAQ